VVKRDVEARRAERSEQADPQREVHLRTASRGDVAEVDDALCGPAERADELDRLRLRRIVVPADVSLQTARRGGIPLLTSSGFATSMSSFPARFASPAASSASSEAAPFVALTTTSAASAASAYDTAPSRGLRVPTSTSCPTSRSFAASVRPTTPAPRTATRI
jgi:hypothetical protein